jgi:acylglycerol lipase
MLSHARATRQEGTFAGRGDVSIFHQSRRPDSAAHSVLLVVHGYGEHSGRYDNVIDYFVPRGFAIYALDHRGHGRSGGERIYVERFDDYVDDLRTFFGIVRAHEPSLPIYMLGHSMGSFIAIAYAASYQSELAALILSGSGIGLGRRTASAGEIDLPATLSRDPAVVEAYRNDPLVFHGLPPASRREAIGALRDQLEDMAHTLILPVIIMAGAASPLGDGPGSEELFEIVGAHDKTLKLYPELMHEIFNEPERNEVFADLEAWLVAHGAHGAPAG